jgi:hypothetical protein
MTDLAFVVVGVLAVVIGSVQAVTSFSWMPRSAVAFLVAMAAVGAGLVLVGIVRLMQRSGVYIDLARGEIRSWSKRLGRKQERLQPLESFDDVAVLEYWDDDAIVNPGLDPRQTTAVWRYHGPP